MRHLYALARQMLRHQRWAIARSAALAALVLISGTALLGLSGWFISAAAVAGLAGTGAVFDVFRPSAGVRFLALGRTISRYGERMLSHDATLRTLAALRVNVLTNLLQWPFSRTTRVRASTWLNRFTRDIDALDGLLLRLVMPAIAAIGAVTFAVALLSQLASAWFAWLILLGLVPGMIIALVQLARVTRRPARLAHQAESAFRMRVVDMLSAQTELVITGRLDKQRQATLDADRVARTHRRAIDRATRRSQLTGTIVETLVGAALLGAGLWLVASGALSAPMMALAFFMLLGLQEMFGPLQRGVAELPAVIDAARRINPLTGTGRAVSGAPGEEHAPASNSINRHVDGTRRGLTAYQVWHQYPGAGAPRVQPMSLTLRPAETVVLTGPSGSGKSTLLHMLAGVLPPSGGQVQLDGVNLAHLAQTQRTRAIALLTQRATLLSGSLRDALALGKPGLSDELAWQALRAVDLDGLARGRNGLDTPLGEAGSGLSGGEQRRLALARVLVRQPQFLLLDEPTEGLDEPTAALVRRGVRELLPQAGILVASHRRSDWQWGDRLIRITAHDATIDTSQAA